MASSFRLSQLNDAVKFERSEDYKREQRCDAFLERIVLYQVGKSEIPSEIEFLRFREDLMRVAAVRALKSGKPGQTA
ncbi:MAG: hypothetical protein LH479_00920 [Polaromonas sp.]|nr:hypothetical protein [Polaromonas sp.]